MRTNRRKQKKFRRLLLLIIVIIFLASSISTVLGQLTNIPIFGGEYPNIAEKNSRYYSGQGQNKVYNEDGYTTTFKTVDGKEFKEYKQNDASWQNNSYWNGTMAEKGCGITSMAIIISGYGKKNTPEDLRQRYQPALNYENVHNELLNLYNIDSSGFYYDQNHLSEDSIKEHLKSNRPILACLWTNPSDNRWTTSSHYVVLLAADDNDKIYVSNPNGLDRTYKSSGWYPTEEIIPFIAKALYIESY